MYILINTMYTHIHTACDCHMNADSAQPWIIEHEERARRVYITEYLAAKSFEAERVARGMQRSAMIMNVRPSFRTAIWRFKARKTALNGVKNVPATSKLETAF